MANMVIHPSLPPRPHFTHAEYTPKSIAKQPEASTSTSSPKCAMCKTQNPKYTCPGCAMRTCSASCSSSHKSKTGCTGVRNKAAYVPMNEYTWGKMMDDYVFLEDVSRNIGEWGNEIARGGYLNGSVNSVGRGGPRGRGRGTRGRGRDTHHAPGRSKRDILKRELDNMDIDVDMLSVGMEKRKLNQSSWDFQSQTAFLTIEFKFYKPKDPLASSSQTRPPPYIILTQRNNIKHTLLSLVQSFIKDRVNSKKENPHPDWVKQLILPDVHDPESFINPHMLMEAHLDPIALRSSIVGRKLIKAYYNFDPTKPLLNLLRNTHFVEFPTIEIWDEFLGATIDAEGIVRRQQHDERPTKRRKMSSKASRLAITSLLGEYGSGSEEDGEENRDGLAALGDYAESEDDQDPTAESPKANNNENELEEDDSAGLSEDDTEVDVDPATLLEIMRTVRSDTPWTNDTEEILDWGDNDGEFE